MQTVDANDLRDELESFDAEKATDVEKLRMGQAALFFAIQVLEEVADKTGDEHARAYLVNQLKTHAGADHGFLCRDFNIDEWVERLENGDEEDEDEG